MLLTDNYAGHNPVMPYPRRVDYLHIYKCYLPCLENETSEFQAEILKQKKKNSYWFSSRMKTVTQKTT